MGSIAVVHTIVFIDDSPDDLYFIRRLATRAGLRHTQVWFEDPWKLQTYLEQEELDGRRPCMLITDVKMPDFSGFDLIHWTRSRRGLPAIRTIVLSGANLPEDREKAHGLGAQYIQKFPTAAEFKHLIAENCDFENQRSNT
jgi:CheY-like chemotaxis protein